MLTKENVADAVEILGFEWDEDNEPHCGRHGLTPFIAEEVRLGRPLVFPGKPARTATHMMIGPAQDGRFWTLHILESHRIGIWRPITGWPSSASETKLYKKQAMT